MPQNIPNFHIPTDLLGLTMADYDAAWAKSQPEAALGAATTKIKQAIGLSTWATVRLVITPSSVYQATGLTYPLKLLFKITNNHPDPVAIESIWFELDPCVRIAPNASLIGSTNKYRPRFFIEKTSTGQDLYVDNCVLEPMKSTISWVPIDPAVGQAALDAAIKMKTAGIWHYRCCWLGSRVIICNYEDSF